MDGDRGDRYGYDALGQVTDVKYDALDPQTGTPTDWSRRVQYQWDPAIEEGDALTGSIAAYVHGAQIDEILARVDASGSVYYHADALGSTEFLTDAVGAVVERYRYDAYGLPTIMGASGSDLGSRTSALGHRFLFTGREWLSGLALYDYRHRVYSPSLGRWLQPDPIRFAAGDVNLYRYCGNRAVLCIDPSGLSEDLKDGEEYVQRYVRDLRPNRLLFLFHWGRAIEFSADTSRDIKEERDDRGRRVYYDWRGRHRLRSDQMGNAGAAYAMTEVWGVEFALIATRVVENLFAHSSGSTKADAEGSYRANDLGINEWLKDPCGQQWLKGRQFIADWL